jgi:hypothetical protein
MRTCILNTLLILSFVAKSNLVQASEWKLRLLNPAAFAQEIVPETRLSTKNGFPHGLIANSPGARNIDSAWYGSPTRRYRHGILGDDIEAGSLHVKIAEGTELTFHLPETEVFEDRAPRLVDLNGDGQTEIITIRSAVREGAAITVYGLRDQQLVELATTPFIGTGYRWLNVAGIEDFLGTGQNQIAYVQTPHIGGTPFLYKFGNHKLELVDQLYGFSNHQIGSIEMRLSAIADINENGRMDLAVPSANRGALRIIGFTDKGLRDLVILLRLNCPKFYRIR